MTTRPALLAVALVALVATGASAALSKQYVDFGKGAARHLMTRAEFAQWKTIDDDAEAQAFIDLFWARRDPTPATPANEMKTAFEERVKLADERYGGLVPGSHTDRGKAFILLGAPVKVRTSGMNTSGSVLTPAQTRTADYNRKEVWIYEQGKTPVDLGAAIAELAFIDAYGSNEWKIDRAPSTDYVSLFDRAASYYVAQPKLTAVPDFAAMAATAPAAPHAVGSFKTDALRAAVEEARAGNAPAPKIFITYGENVATTGQYFVPVSLYIPKSAGVSAGAPVTLFGMIEKNGEPVAIIEEPAKLHESKGDFYVDKSLQIPPGTYKATFGIAQNGAPVSLVTTDMKLSGVEKDASGASALMLSNNIYPMTEAQAPTEPFAFGGLKVVPKADKVFRTSEELWYFLELRNPGINNDTGKPRTAVKVTMAGTTADGKKVRMAGAAQETPAEESKGMPGRYVIGSTIPLAKIKPGDYTLTVKVTDMVKNQTYDLSGDFTIVE